MSNEYNLDVKQKYEGMKMTTKYGTPFVVKEYIDRKNIIIEFPFSGIQKRIRLDKIVTDPPIVGDPFYKRDGCFRPFIFKDPKAIYEGLILQNYYGEKYKIIEYNGYNDITVEFLDEYKYRVKLDYGDIKTGNIRNAYRINFAGGYVGEDMTYRGTEFKWLNRTWHDVLIRANRKDIMHNKDKFTYDNCTVCPEWLNYGNFARDYMNKLLPLNPNFSYSIDKDLLYDKYKDKTGGYKYYSNETTVLLPNELNSSIERIMNNNLLIINSYDYTHRYQRLMEWKDKVTWYWMNNAISEIAYINLLELADNKIEEMKQKFPELERMRIGKEGI